MPPRATNTAIALCAAVAILATAGWADEVVESSSKTIEQSAQPDENSRILQRVRAAVKRNHLTRLPDSCLIFEMDDSPPAGMVVVNVREKHDQACGGDPATSPRLFGVRVDKKTNKMWTDARSDAGEFERLKR